jgi:hypothetical protein
LILSRAAHVFHIPYPGESSDALRVDVTPERGSHMETLAIYFPVVLRDEAVMRIHWGETIVPIRIKARTVRTSVDRRRSRGELTGWGWSEAQNLHRFYRPRASGFRAVMSGDRLGWRSHDPVRR